MSFHTLKDNHSGAGTNSNILNNTIVAQSGSSGQIKIGAKSSLADVSDVTINATCGNTVIFEGAIPVDLLGNYPQFQVSVLCPPSTPIQLSTTATAAAAIYFTIQT